MNTDTDADTDLDTDNGPETAAPVNGDRLPLSQIRIDGGTQSRAGLNLDHVSDLAEALRAGVALPPVGVFYDGAAYWLWDGFHRHDAHGRAGVESIAVEIRQGSREAAQDAACAANRAHGLRRTNEDKRRAVRSMLERHPDWSDRRIGEWVGVHNETVGAVRSTDGIRQSTARVGADGRTYETARIGRRPDPDPAPKAETPTSSDPDALARVEASGVKGASWRNAPPATPPPEPVTVRLTGPAERLEESPTAAEEARPPVVVEARGSLEGAESLPDDERAEFDAYYTPDATALACFRWLCRELDLPDELDIVEPAVGGGAWVRAIREVRPKAIVDRFDLDPAAPGLAGARRGIESAQARDWLGAIGGKYAKRTSWDLCIGNRPYDGDFAAWFERSIERADIVAYLERETITGTEKRLPWWIAHRPSYVVKVVPRPKWEGPGARDNADFSDSVLVVWLADDPEGSTRWDWIRRPRDRVTATCEVCHAEFTATRPGHTVCGSTCRKRKQRGTPAPYVVTEADRAAMRRAAELVPVPVPALSLEQVRAHVLATAAREGE